MLPGCIAGFTAGHMLPLNPVFYQVFISALFFRFPVTGVFFTGYICSECTDYVHYLQNTGERAVLPAIFW